MLWANSQDLPHFIHLIEDVNAENLCESSVGFNQTCQHRDRGCFTGTVVAKEGKDLPLVHCKIDVAYSGLISELFDETSDLQAVIIFFLLFERLSNAFKVSWVFVTNVILFKQSLLLILVTDLCWFSFAAEVPWLGNSELTWHNLVKIEPEDGVEYDVANHHYETSPERVSLVDDWSCAQGQSFLCLVVVEENLLDHLVHANVW